MATGNSFHLNRKFLSDAADVAVTLASPDAPLLLAAFQSPTQPIPAGSFELGRMQASAGGDGKIGLGDQGSVSFDGHGEATFGLGIYADGAAALKAAMPAAELSVGLTLAQPAATRFIVLAASYQADVSAKGAVALGAGVGATFGVKGKAGGGYALLYRFSDTAPAKQVATEFLQCWALPKQVKSATDLQPGTWVMAEVDGSIALSIGVQAGYDFSWVRSLDGALQGDIGLRVQLGASAALGFEASGKYAVVVGRESEAEVVRLRLYKMAHKGWNFALDAKASFKSVLPPFFDQPHKAEDLVSAIFGLNNSQVFEVLKETRAFVTSKESLEDKLAGVLMHAGGTALQAATGLTESQIQEIYEAGREKVTGLLGKLDQLTKTGGHDLTSMLLSLSGQDLSQLESGLRLLVDPAQPVETVVKQLLSKAGFERTPLGRAIEAAVGPGLGVVTNTEIAKKLKTIAQDALNVIEGGTLQKVLDFIRREVSFDRIKKAVDDADFATVDNLLKDRVAKFLGQQTAVLADLNKVQDVARTVFARADKFYEMALKAAKQKQEFSFSARYARSTTSTALVDVSFNTQNADAATLEMLAQAINGDFGNLLIHEHPAITLHMAELSHNISRSVSTELSMPFGDVSSSSKLLSSAKLVIAEDDGRVLAYSLDTTDKKSERRSLFGARSGRDSTFTVAATLPASVKNGVRTWKEGTFNYSFRMERAVRQMRASQFQSEIGPLVEQYLPSAFAPPAHSFPEWVADLDKLLDARDPNSGTHDIGDTLVRLTLSAPPAYLKAWLKAPRERHSPVYMDLSRALQRRLKEIVLFYYFADVDNYKDIAAAAPPLVYAAIPPSTNIRLSGDTLTRDLDTDVYWDCFDAAQVLAMAQLASTRRALQQRLGTVSTMLRGIPDLAQTARFYEPSAVPSVLGDALKKHSASSRLPEFLSSLLQMELKLVGNAVDAGVAMAEFRTLGTENPAEALKKLAAFGEELATAFNETIGDNPFLSGAARPLSTLLFMEAAQVFDRSISGKVAAQLDIQVIKSGQLSVDDMLAGKIADKPELILFEQPLVEA
ncbi:MAG: hypothetical protein NTV70_05025 [Acidobacteria bacterium]|nr:hypothetical protein [Acidobacteriota bacterium]